jgi:hypothetical protein
MFMDKSSTVCWREEQNVGNVTFCSFEFRFPRGII